jgi:hypothetical protein
LFQRAKEILEDPEVKGIHTKDFLSPKTIFKMENGENCCLLLICRGAVYGFIVI